MDCGNSERQRSQKDAIPFESCDSDGRKGAKLFARFCFAGERLPPILGQVGVFFFSVFKSELVSFFFSGDFIFFSKIAWFRVEDMRSTAPAPTVDPFVAKLRANAARAPCYRPPPVGHLVLDS